MSIRMLVSAAVAAFALTAGAAHAETALSIYLNGQVDYSSIDSSGPGDDDSTNVDVNGAAALAISQHVGAQVDANYTFVDSDVSDDDFISGTAHLFYRSPSALVGGFLGAASVADTTAWGGGVEGKLYRGNLTFSGDVTYANDDDLNTDLWAASADVAYFYNDNLSTHFGVGLGTIEPDVGDDSSFWDINVGAAYQLASVPVGFTVNLGYADADDADIQATTLSVGVNYVFTGESLHTRNTTGASQNGFLSGVLGSLF